MDCNIAAHNEIQSSLHYSAQCGKVEILPSLFFVFGTRVAVLALQRAGNSISMSKTGTKKYLGTGTASNNNKTNSGTHSCAWLNKTKILHNNPTATRIFKFRFVLK